MRDVKRVKNCSTGWSWDHNSFSHNDEPSLDAKVTPHRSKWKKMVRAHFEAPLHGIPKRPVLVIQVLAKRNEQGIVLPDAKDRNLGRLSAGK